jgi:hypothetical protein
MLPLMAKKLSGLPRPGLAGFESEAMEHSVRPHQPRRLDWWGTEFV